MGNQGADRRLPTVPCRRRRCALAAARARYRQRPQQHRLRGPFAAVDARPGREGAPPRAALGGGAAAGRGVRRPGGAPPTAEDAEEPPVARAGVDDARLEGRPRRVAPVSGAHRARGARAELGTAHAIHMPCTCHTHEGCTCVYMHGVHARQRPPEGGTHLQHTRSHAARAQRCAGRRGVWCTASCCGRCALWALCAVGAVGAALDRARPSSGRPSARHQHAIEC